MITRDVGQGRAFWAHRRAAAATALSPGDWPTPLLEGATAVHVCADPMRTDGGRSAVLSLARAARDAGLLVTADANVRSHLWRSPDDARAVIAELAPLVDVLKCNHKEAALLTASSGAATPRATDVSAVGAHAAVADAASVRVAAIDAARILAGMGRGSAVVTCGGGGCVWTSGPDEGQRLAEPIASVDATGAGDAFAAGLLMGLLDGPLDAAAIERASRLAADACGHMGAV